MKFSIIIIALLSVVLTSGAIAQQKDTPPQETTDKSWKNNVSTRMISRIYTAYEFGEDEFQVVKLTLTPEVKVKLGDNLRFTGIVRFYGEMLDNLEPGRPGQSTVSSASSRMLLGDRFEMELREFYFDWFVGSKTTLRLGKQQIVWGETDGLKLLDVVNPQNFREFMLEEFEESRIPLWSVKAQFPIKAIDVEVVWIPDLTYHDIPGLNAPYFPNAIVPAPPDNVQAQLLPADKPGNVITDSDIGVKLSAFVKGWDVSLNYLYHYDDMPALKRSISSDADGVPELYVVPKYHRLHTLGGSFNNAVGPITLRGELAYHHGRHFMTDSQDDADGIVKSNQFLIAAGVDWMFGESLLSMQVFNDRLMKSIPAYNRERNETNISFLAAQELANDDLRLEVLMVQNLNHCDGMIRPKGSYYLKSNVQLSAGFDIFYGDDKGMFGQYKDRTRVFVGLEWGI